MKVTAAQKRFYENATLMAAARLVFEKLASNNFPERALGDVADTTSGGTPSRSNSAYYGGDIPWIKSGDLNDGLIIEVPERITEDGLENSSAKVFPAGTLVIALYGATVGKTGILAFEAASNQAVCAVIPKNEAIKRDYLHWFFRYKRPEFLSSSFGGAQPNISQSYLREIVIPIPPVGTQLEICRFLNAVERLSAVASLMV